MSSEWLRLPGPKSGLHALRIVPRDDLPGDDLLVAGVGFEPTTSGL